MDTLLKERNIERDYFYSWNNHRLPSLRTHPTLLKNFFALHHYVRPNTDFSVCKSTKSLKNSSYDSCARIDLPVDGTDPKKDTQRILNETASWIPPLRPHEDQDIKRFHQECELCHLFSDFDCTSVVIDKEDKDFSIRFRMASKDLSVTRSVNSLHLLGTHLLEMTPYLCIPRVNTKAKKMGLYFQWYINYIARSTRHSGKTVLLIFLTRPSYAEEIRNVRKNMPFTLEQKTKQTLFSWMKNGAQYAAAFFPVFRFNSNTNKIDKEEMKRRFELFGSTIHETYVSLLRTLEYLTNWEKMWFSLCREDEQVRISMGKMNHQLEELSTAIKSQETLLENLSQCFRRKEADEIQTRSTSLPLYPDSLPTSITSLRGVQWNTHSQPSLARMSKSFENLTLDSLVNTNSWHPLNGISPSEPERPGSKKKKNGQVFEQSSLISRSPTLEGELSTKFHIAYQVTASVVELLQRAIECSKECEKCFNKLRAQEENISTRHSEGEIDALGRELCALEEGFGLYKEHIHEQIKKSRHLIEKKFSACVYLCSIWIHC